MEDQDKNFVVSATEFKARCLALLDEVEKGGVAITITRHGHPVGVLGAVAKEAWKSPANSWANKAKIAGDIVNTETADLWNVVSAK